MLDFVIICPLQLEYKAVIKHLNRVQSDNFPLYQDLYTIGKLKEVNNSPTIGCFEVETKSRDLGAQVLKILTLFKPKMILLVGIAAGIKDVSTGDVVVATHARTVDYGKDTDDGLLPRMEVVESNRRLLGLAKKMALSKERSYKIAFGSIASTHRVVDGVKSYTYQMIKKYVSNAIAYEMEAIPFAQGVSEYAQYFPWLNIRGISDYADKKIDSEYDGSREIAAERAADFAIQLIKKLPISFASNDHRPNHNVVIYHNHTVASSFFIRKPQKGILQINNRQLKLVGDQQNFEISKIQSINFVKLTGDIMPSWTRIIYADGEKMIYLKERNKLSGLTNIIGGSRTIYHELLALQTEFQSE